MSKFMSWLDSYNYTNHLQYKEGKPLNIHAQCSQSLLWLFPANQLLSHRIFAYRIYVLAKFQRQTDLYTSGPQTSIFHEVKFFQMQVSAHLSSSKVDEGNAPTKVKNKDRGFSLLVQVIEIGCIHHHHISRIRSLTLYIYII